GDQHRLQDGARRVDGSRIAGRAGTDDENGRMDGVHESLCGAAATRGGTMSSRIAGNVCAGRRPAKQAWASVPGKLGMSRFRAHFSRSWLEAASNSFNTVVRTRAKRAIMPTCAELDAIDWKILREL